MRKSSIYIASNICSFPREINSLVNQGIGRNFYKNRLYENKGFPELLNIILPEYHRILDVGCGNGANMHLLSQRGHECIGLTVSEAEAHLVHEQGYECVVCDVTSEQLPFPAQSFDALLFCHVLEHLPWPEVVLRRYLHLLRPGGGIYIALPNILHLVQRLQFCRGRFRYTETGLMDRGHLRFFDFVTARQLAETCGLKVVRHFGIGQCPQGPLRKLAPALSQRIDRWTSQQWPGLFAFHLIIFALWKG